jgi:haloalkane dehalogenase
MKLPFEVDAQLFPVEHHFIELNGTSIHYISEGSGDTLLFLHGNPAWSFLYRKMIAALSTEFHCVALDFPGYGMSGVPAGYRFTPREHSLVLETFVESLRLTDITMMVQDWGGPIGFGFASRHPDKVRGFIIGNTFAWPLNDLLRIRIFSWVMGGPIGRSLTRLFNFVPRFFFWRGFAKRPKPEVLDMYMEPWRDPKRREPAVVGPRQLIAAAPFLAEVEAGLAKLADKPALVVWGTSDFAFGPKERMRFEQAFPRHRTFLLDDASHFLQEDVGERIADYVRQFMTEERAACQRGV